MPRRPLGPCPFPGCPNRADCPAHARRHARWPERPRPTRQAQGYGADWQRIRAQFLARYPQCMHPGCLAPATQVDHNLALRKGGTHDWGNLRGLCATHHSQKTNAVDGGGWKRRERA